MKRLALLLMLLAPCWLPAAGDDVRIVTSATASSSVNPVKLDVGKFIWISLPTWENEITFYSDPEDQKALTLYPVKPDVDFPGVFHQGDLRSKVHRSPKSVSEVLMVTGEEPGLVTISAWGVKKEGEKLKPVRLNQVVVSVGGAKPSPSPTPQPDPPKPDPQPQPTAKKVYLVSIRNQVGIPPAEAVLLNDTAFWDSLKTEGHEWDHFSNVVSVDGKETPQKKLGYLDAVSDIPLTALLLIEKTDGGSPAKVLRKIPYTKDGRTLTKDDVRALLKEVVR